MTSSTPKQVSAITEEDTRLMHPLHMLTVNRNGITLLIMEAIPHQNQNV